MSEHGAALQSYNQELVKCLEDLKIKRHEVEAIIVTEERAKADLDVQIEQLCKERNLIIGKIENHRKLFESYERTIVDTEDGFKKILESSQTLLNLAQHEANKLQDMSNTKWLL